MTAQPNKARGSLALTNARVDALQRLIEHGFQETQAWFHGADDDAFVGYGSDRAEVLDDWAGIALELGLEHLAKACSELADDVRDAVKDYLKERR